MKRVILIGPGASGKDYLKAELEKKGFKCSVSYTTRNPRPGEVEGVSYYFINDEQFKAMIDKDEFREWNKFADKWYYGTSKKHFEAANLFIMTPSGVRALTPEERAESCIIYLNMSEEVRRARLMERADKDEPERRLATDRADFEGYKDFDIQVTDPQFNYVDVLETIFLLERQWSGDTTKPSIRDWFLLKDGGAELKAVGIELK